MSEFFDQLNQDYSAFIAKQQVFFVATAAGGARINLSPKGMDSFRVLGDRRVGYLDVGGSGNETHAHVAADGRATIIFCVFDRERQTLSKYHTADDPVERMAKIAERTQSIDSLPVSGQTWLPWTKGHN